MMRKVLLLVVILITFMAVSQESTYAVTTLFIGKSTDGDGTSYDYSQGALNPAQTGDINTNQIEFTNISSIKKIKINVDYEFGDFKYARPTPTIELWDVQVGFPLVTQEKGIVYLTTGLINYDENTTIGLSGPIAKHQANTGTLGFDVVCTPTDKFQFELDLHHSVGGSSRLIYGSSSNNYDSSLSLTTYQVKVQYILTDTIGLSVHYRSLDYNVHNLIDAVKISLTTLGVIYRF